MSRQHTQGSVFRPTSSQSMHTRRKNTLQRGGISRKTRPDIIRCSRPTFFAVLVKDNPVFRDVQRMRERGGVYNVLRADDAPVARVCLCSRERMGREKCVLAIAERDLREMQCMWEY